MESNIIEFLLPAALFIIMFGLGLTLTVRDFKNIFFHPKAVFVGSATQLILLPLLGFAVAALMLNDNPELAVGLVILAACPGGPTSNLYTHLGNGDIALCITLTAISSCVKIFTIPLIVNFALNFFMHKEQEIQLDIGQSIIKIFSITIIPALIGMSTRALAPVFAAKAENPLKIISAGFLALVVMAAVIEEKNNIVNYLRLAGPAALVLNLTGITVGYFLPQLLRLDIKKQLTISIESSIQNGALAITIASSPLMLNNTTMAIPAAVYSMIMFCTGLVFIGFLNKRRKMIESKKA
jgi:bile acid:Na+ symporter, BASS family